MNRSVHALKRITGAARISLLYVQEIMLPGDLPMRRHKKPFSTVASLSSCVFLVLFPFKAGVFYQLMILFIMFFIIVKVFLIRQSSFPKTAAVIHKWACTPPFYAHTIQRKANVRRNCREKKIQFLFAPPVGQTGPPCIRASHYTDYDLSGNQDDFLSDDF